MNKIGFYIKSIIATGDGMITSRVDFKDGCNLLFGPSEKGKSSVYSIIDFMLGASSDPNEVKESVGYTDYYMEFVTYKDNIIHTAHKHVGESNVIVTDCDFGHLNNSTVSGRNYSKKTYSNYLMELNGYAHDIQLKKSATSKMSLNFTLARHLFLVSEDRVVSKQPIFLPSKEYTEQTQQKSFLYYLTSGVDDSSFKEAEDEKIRRSRIGGMITLAQESLDSINTKILELGDVSYADFNGQEFYEANKEQIRKQETVLSELYNRRKEDEDDLRKLHSQLLFAQEFVKRMGLLEKHYNIDIQRYEHLYQGLSLMIPLSEEHTCPVCHSHIVDSEIVEEDYKEALKSEYEKTKSKLTDIEKVIIHKKNEINKIETQIQTISSKINNVISEICKFEPQIDNLKNTLQKYQENIEKKTYCSFLQSEAQRLNKQIDELQKQQKEKPATSNYSRQTDIDLEFCNSIKSKLEAWNVIGDIPVVYEESEFDFNIGGQKRIMCGKGTRGVTCTAIIMTLVEFCKHKDIPFSQLLVVDSPLTAHFNDECVAPNKTTQAKFFQYCNETDFDYQLILIDNKAPNATERSQMNGINFIEFSESERKGFYLGKENVNELF